MTLVYKQSYHLLLFSNIVETVLNSQARENNDL